MSRLLSKERIVAPPGFNRWRVPPASIAIHLCIGSVYAWSIFNPPLTRVHGVVASAAGRLDARRRSSWIFTVAIVVPRACRRRSRASGWSESARGRSAWSPRVCWGGGFLLGALAISLHQLWLLYLGYGVIGGCGLGLGYVSPVSTLIRWFPDRRGMAAGMAIMGFGGGAIIGAPLKEFLLSTFYRAPEYLGPRIGASSSPTRPARDSPSRDGQLREVVVARREAKSDKCSCLRPPGVYVVGTGSTGVAQTFVVARRRLLPASCSSRRSRIAFQRPAGSPRVGRRRRRGRRAQRMISTHNVAHRPGAATRRSSICCGSCSAST